MNLRRYRSEDLPALSRLFGETVRRVNIRDYTPAQVEAWSAGQADLLARDGWFRRLHTLVAEADGRIVGHILFTKIRIGTSTQLALVPLSVLPAFQGQGVGSALVRRGHQIARDLGYSYSVVLGSETYYPRFGYVPAEQLGIQAPFPVPAENFMAVKLTEDAPPVRGMVQYAPEFGI